MNKFTRMIDVLDLFSESNTVLTAEDIASGLQVSRPTAFRYVRELSAAGFLANYSGRYSLGARIITLDRRIRESDPVLKAARPVMKALSLETGCSSILCRMYNEEVINVHDEVGYGDPQVRYAGRGTPLPLFRGSASKIMLANLPPGRLRKIYERHSTDPNVTAISTDWPGLRAYYAKIRQTGHYISRQELDPHTIGIGSPITVAKVGTVAAISLVFSANRLDLFNIDGLAAMVKVRCSEVAMQLGPLAESSDWANSVN